MIIRIWNTEYLEEKCLKKGIWILQTMFGTACPFARHSVLILTQYTFFLLADITCIVVYPVPYIFIGPMNMGTSMPWVKHWLLCLERPCSLCLQQMPNEHVKHLSLCLSLSLRMSLSLPLSLFFSLILSLVNREHEQRVNSLFTIHQRMR